MKYHSLAGFLFLFLIEGLQGQNQPIPDAKLEDTVFLKELAARMIEAAVEDYTPADHVLPDQKADYAAPASITESALKDMNTAFINSFYIKPSPFNKDEMMIEYDNFFYPEPRLVNIDLRWLKVVDQSGKNLLKKADHTKESSSMNLQYTGNQTIQLINENTQSVIRAEGEVVVKAPLSFEKVTFKKNELNITKSLDTFKVRLLRMENNLASAWIDGDYQNIQLYPYNVHGIPLETSGSTSMILDGHIKELAALHLPNDLGSGAFMYIKTNGTIDRLDIVAVTRMSVQKIKVTAIPEPVFKEGKAKIDRERYVKYIPQDFSSLSKPDTNLFTAKQNLQILSKYSEWEKETKWSLQYQLPVQYPQTSYAVAEYEQVSILSKNKVIKTFQTEGYFDRESGILRMTPVTDETKPISFDEARGFISLKYPVSLQTVTVKKGEKKYGIYTFEGNALTLNEEEMGSVKEYMNDGTIDPIRVYGKGKWPLKKDNYYTSESKDSINLSRQYFWGNISMVQIDQPTEWIAMKIPFTVKLSTEKKTIKADAKKPIKKKK